MKLAAVVLAGGEGRRMGRPKQLVDWGGRPLLEHVLREVKRWPVDEVWVVLGAGAEDILDRVDLEGVDVVINEDWEEGLASSLRVALDALLRHSRADAAIVALGDQPSVDPDVVRALIEAYRRSRKPAVVPKYRYAWGNPVLVDRRLWERLMSLEGDEGAKRLLQSHPEWVEEVWLDQLAPRDVDTPLDVEELAPRHPAPEA